MALFFGVHYIFSEYKKRLIDYIICVGDIMSIIMILQLLKLPIIVDIFDCRATGTFYNENHLAYFLCIGIMLAWGCLVYKGLSKKRWFNLSSFILCVYSLIQNGTFGSLLAVILALLICSVIYCIRGQYKLVRIVMPVLVIGIIIAVNILNIGVLDKTQSVSVGVDNLITTTDGMANGETYSYDIGNGRIILWKHTLEKIKDKPIFGYGPEGLIASFEELELWTDRPHNEYLQLMAFSGIPALLLYLAAVVLLFINRIKNIRKISDICVISGGATMAYMFSACFGNTMFYTVPFFTIILAMVCSEN